MPVDRGRLIERVRELDDDLRALRDLQQRSRILAVEREHRERLSLEWASHDSGRQPQRITTRQAHESPRLDDRKAVGVRDPRQVRSRVRPERHLGWKHRDPGWHRHHRPGERVASSMLMLVASRILARGAKHELHEVRRLEPCARRHPAKHEATSHVRCGSRFLRRNEDDELVERYRGKRRASVVDNAKPLNDVHRWRSRPCDVGGVATERRRPSEPAERDRWRVAQVAVDGDVDRERSCRSPELDSPAT